MKSERRGTVDRLNVIEEQTRESGGILRLDGDNGDWFPVWDYYSRMFYVGV
jgi:hypothetical protein